MRIAFCAQHPYYGGLNNNGGSRTILLSAATLRKLGHTVNVITQADGFSWFKHPKPLKTIPRDTDVCIAVGVSDIETMLESKPKRAKAFWWCRLLETYQMPKGKILKRAGMVKTLVNSENLQWWFKQHNVDTTVVYQGVDLGAWKDLDRRPEKKTIGFLLSQKKRKQFKIAKRIARRFGDVYDYVGFGAKGDLSGPIKSFIYKRVKTFRANPTHDQLLGIYNQCHVWVSTSAREGLHNPPLEAALSGCELVCNGVLHGGTADYCVHEKTGYRFVENSTTSACEQILRCDGNLVVPCQGLIREKIGSREEAMKKLVEVTSA